MRLPILGAFGMPSSVGEYGWGGSYHSSYWIDPEEELEVVYFMQLIPAGNIDDYAEFRALVYQAITDNAGSDETARRVP